MPTSAESVCCREIAEVGIRLDEETPPPQCITQHTGFASVCLEIHVLRTAYFQFRQLYGGEEDGPPTNEYNFNFQEFSSYGLPTVVPLVLGMARS